MNSPANVAGSPAIERDVPERVPTDWKTGAMQKRIRRRYAAERRFRFFGLAAVVLVNAEALRAPLWWAPFDGIPPVYAALAAEPNAVVAEMPVYSPRNIFGNARYMLNATVHRHPIVNGYSGFMPPSYGPMQASVASFPESDALAALHALGVTHVVVHGNRMSGPRLARIAQSPALSRVASDGPITIYRLRSGGTSP